jgi:hypothetical protein
MDSLPYMKRKSLEPKEHLLLATALEGSLSAAKRASTPLGLTSGVPPPTGLNVSQVHGRGVRRGSVDSASVFYSSATVPGPTAVERHSEVRDETSRHHQFVKSSFAKRKSGKVLRFLFFLCVCVSVALFLMPFSFAFPSIIAPNSRRMSMVSRLCQEQGCHLPRRVCSTSYPLASFSGRCL